MIERDFSAWDFVKQEPKQTNEYSTIIGGTGNYLTVDGNGVTTTIGGTGNYLTTDGNGVTTWTSTIGGGYNNVILGSNTTITANVNDTVFMTNLRVGGSAEIPPSEGQMRTIMDEDGYWLTQTFITEIENPNGRWVTISRTGSMCTTEYNTTPRLSMWDKIKNRLMKSQVFNSKA